MPGGDRGAGLGGGQEAPEWAPGAGCGQEAPPAPAPSPGPFPARARARRPGRYCSAASPRAEPGARHPAAALGSPCKMALTPPFPGCGGGRDRGDGPGLAANPRPPPPAQSCYPRPPPPPPPPPPPGHLRPDRSDFPQTPTDPGELPLQTAIMEESRTSRLPHIPKMFGDPYAACRLLLVGTQVSSLYCYNYFSRTGFFAFHSCHVSNVFPHSHKMAAAAPSIIS
nr:basic proline-rich protein-like isoform X2 [Vicugna pacos]